MDIVRKQLSGQEIVPAFIRYNDGTGVVQTTPDNGATWVDSPQSDPRNTNAFPPLTGATARCDASERMTALVQGLITDIDAKLQAGAAAAEIASLILLVLAFIPLIGIFAAFIGAIASQYVVVGYAAFHAAFSGFDWTAFKCELYALIDAQGRLNASTFAQFQTWVTDTYSSPLDTILNALLSTLGYGGLNDAAATRGETGSCASCSSTFDYFEHFLSQLLPGTTPGGDNVHLPADYAYGATAYSLVADGCSDTGNWLKGAQSPVAPTVYIVQVTIDLGQERSISNISFLQYKEHSSAGHEIRVFNQAGEVVYNKAYSVTTGGTGCISFSQSVSVTGRYITLLIAVGSTTLKTYLSYIRVQGSI